MPAHARASGDRAGEHDPRVTVLFLAGMPRSGTHLVSLAVADGRRAVALGELVHLWDRSLIGDGRCACGAAFSGCAFWRQVGTVAFGGWDRVDAERLVELRARLDRLARVPRLVAPHGGRPGGDDEAGDYAGHYARIHRAAREITGADAVVDASKQPALAFHLARAGAIDLRVVHVVRDPRAVADAWRPVPGRPATGHPCAEPRRSRAPADGDPARVARRWVATNLAVEALRTRGVPLLRVRYEDVIAAPVETVRRLHRFAGIAAPETPAGLTDGTLRPLPHHWCSGNPQRFPGLEIALERDDAWHHRLPTAARRSVTRIAAPLMRAYGYPLRPPH